MSSLIGKDNEVSNKIAQVEQDNEIRNPAVPLFTRVPLVTEIPVQGFVIATISGTSYIYTKIGSTRYRVALTAV